MLKESLKLRDEITLDEVRKAKTLAHLEMIAIRRENDAQFQALSAEKLDAEVLNDRIENMNWDYEKVASAIPTQLTFHRQDGEDNWDITSGTKESKNAIYFRMRQVDRFGGVEEFYFETGVEPIAIHTDSHRPELRETSNSEREILPAEILFKRMWKQLLDHHDAPYASDKQKFDS